MKRLLELIVMVLGIDPYRILAVRNLPRFLRERRKFLSLANGQVQSKLFPVLFDYSDSAGVMGGHYFHQDLHVAQRIYLSNPKRHIDVGSRIDGFVAHVASFRSIEILDIREVTSSVPEISFIQHDFMSPVRIKTDSLSCLHTIEHFGLGRYGDPIDPEGHIKGFGNLVNCLEKGATFYLSFPVGDMERVEFNAHRVFRPDSVFSWKGAEKLELAQFSFVDDSGSFHRDALVQTALDLKMSYGCGIYEFRRK